jgi:uncharacterized protein YecT (DUF1311 family)
MMLSRNYRIAMLALTGCVLPLAAAAQQAGGPGMLDVAGLSSTYTACLKSANEKTLAVDACMSSELKSQDARLNKVYKSLLDTLKPDAKKALVDAERVWLQSKSKDEGFETALYGDTQVANAQQLQNNLYRVTARANALEKYLTFAQL